MKKNQNFSNSNYNHRPRAEKAYALKICPLINCPKPDIKHDISARKPCFFIREYGNRPNVKVMFNNVQKYQSA